MAITCRIRFQFWNRIYRQNRTIHFIRIVKRKIRWYNDSRRRTIRKRKSADSIESHTKNKKNTGFTYEKDLNPGGKRYIPGTTDQILSAIDVLVDGRFEKDLYSIMLVFRGSSNQRIIDMKKSNYDNIIIKEI